MTHEDDDVRGLVERVFQAVPRQGFERRVLGTLTGASRSAPVASRARGPRLRRWPVPAALAGAGVAVVVAVGLLGPASPPRQARGAPGAAAAAGVPSIQTIDARLVAAREAHRDEIVHQTATRTEGTGKETYEIYRAEYWIWPAAEQPGAEVRARTLTPGQSDQEEIFTAPAALDGKGGTVTGELIVVDFASRTWSDQTSTTVPQVSSAAVIDYRAGIEAGYFRVAGIVRLHGRRAIQLNRVKNGSVLTFQSIFIDADTYLPMKQVSDEGNGMVLAYEFEFLPPTGENVARLRPVIPAAFEHTAAPPSPHGQR